LHASFISWNPGRYNPDTSRPPHTVNPGRPSKRKKKKKKKKKKKAIQSD
jgi:hypothetical protein